MKCTRMWWKCFLFIPSFFLIVANDSWIPFLLSPFILSIVQLRRGAVFVKGDNNNHFIIHFWRIRTVTFPSEAEKDKTYEVKNGKKSVYFPSKLAFQPLILYFVRVFVPISTLIWRANTYLYHQGDGVNRRNETTKTQLSLILLMITLSHFSFFPTTNVLTVSKLFSLHGKDTSVLIAAHYFPVKNGK